jgi:hypothetical protein
MKQETFVELMMLEHPKIPKLLMEQTAKSLWDPHTSSFHKWAMLVGVLRLSPANAAIIIRHAGDVVAQEKEATAHEIARLVQKCCEMWQGTAPKGSGHAILAELLDSLQAIALLPSLPPESSIKATVEARAESALEAWKQAGFPGVPQ